MNDLISRQNAIDKYGDWYVEEGTEDGFIGTVKQLLEGLPPAEPHWIPVTQELPEDDTVVLVCGKNGGIYTAIHNNSKTWVKGWWKMNSKNHYCNPTAWMLLPEPYNEVTK